VLERPELVALLTGEHAPISDGAREELLRRRFSFFPDDLVVITWDRAFIYDPRHSADVAEVLEIANAQLLEMRAYDEMLDAEMPRVREMVQETRRRTPLRDAHRYKHLARRLYSLVAEVSEMTERIDNALQVTGNVYLASIYESAMELFRVPVVSAAVDRKLAIIRETYDMLRDEAAAARGEALELSVLILIALEVVLSLIHT
jgi:hypothetical protein